MFRHRIWLAGAGLAAAALVNMPALAQSVISARSGLVGLVDGAAFLDEKPIQAKRGTFPEMAEKSVLRTTDGRAEVLLSPGVFLRLGERSSLRMVRNRLVDTRVEILTGSAVIEAAEVNKDSSVTIECKGATILLKKTGIYRFDLEPARLRVFAGSASVQLGGRAIDVGAGKMIAFEGESASVVLKFKKDLTDDLDRWSRRRAEQVAMANVSSAKAMLDAGYTLSAGMWRWNPYFGMYTFIPGHGSPMSPYGFRYWSPGTVARVFYTPPPASSGGYNASDNSYQSAASTSSGYSGTAASSNSGNTYSSPAASSSSGTSAASSAGSSSVGQGASGGGGRGR